MSAEHTEKKILRFPESIDLPERRSMVHDFLKDGFHALEYSQDYREVKGAKDLPLYTDEPGTILHTPVQFTRRSGSFTVDVLHTATEQGLRIQHNIPTGHGEPVIQAIQIYRKTPGGNVATQADFSYTFAASRKEKPTVFANTKEGAEKVQAFLDAFWEETYAQAGVQPLGLDWMKTYKPYGENHEAFRHWFEGLPWIHRLELNETLGILLKKGDF